MEYHPVVTLQQRCRQFLVSCFWYARTSWSQLYALPRTYHLCVSWTIQQGFKGLPLDRQSLSANAAACHTLD
jgi:hypothetical protein